MSEPSSVQVSADWEKLEDESAELFSFEDLERVWKEKGFTQREFYELYKVIANSSKKEVIALLNFAKGQKQQFRGKPGRKPEVQQHVTWIMHSRNAEKFHSTEAILTYLTDLEAIREISRATRYRIIAKLRKHNYDI
jgi:hypothetical protein